MELKGRKDDYTKFYEIIDEIGKGEHGKIFRAKHKKSNELRALKIIEIEKENMKYIKSEIKNMKICSDGNENSVKYYEHFYNNDKIIIVMELCDKKSLQTILDEKEEGFKCEEIFNIMNQLNNTFKIMHKNNIIHRDIKLDNILVKYKDNKDSNINFMVKLTDYGISKQITNATKGKTAIGTYLTMAPEIMEGKKRKYDCKCDLWSIGIIIYQLFFKEYPYDGDTPVAIYNQIIEDGKSILRKTKNAKLDNLIDSLLTKDPEERINYEDYFNHPFFKENLNQYIININNYIVGEIEVKEENEEIRIINSSEEYYKNTVFFDCLEDCSNEKEIKDNCIIKINGEIIPFSYFYKFKKKGKYKIEYFFKNSLINTNYMFSECKSLTNINLSNFNTQNVTDKSGIFNECESLRKENVITNDENILNEVE